MVPIDSLHGTVLPTQLGGLPIWRLFGFGIVLAVALGVLYVVSRSSTASNPVYEEDDDDSGLFNPGPAYGATGTLDVEEVLQVDGGAGESSGDDGDATDADEGEQGEDDAGRFADWDDEDESRFTHEVVGERRRGLLVEVVDPDGAASFFVDGWDGVDPTVTPTSARDRRHGEDWTAAATAYLRDRAVNGTLRDGEADLERERE